MPDILHSAIIYVSPDQVFKAITEPQCLRQWWTPHVEGEIQLGASFQTSFGGGRFMIEMGVVQFEPDSKVEWLIQQGNPEWINTHVTWDISPVGTGSKVLLGHHGFASADGSLPQTSYNWAYYLTSLTSYLETGKGNPGGLDDRLRQ